ncbi:Transcriptional regulator, AcrR family [hydrothermal vent metagenome]|uniref:Transcriptional regulator, AcrR family n=1 Tax=hydrothermal vent metagenome TaxID=652676 RepID=A0A3B0X100_9ZZZZ
MRYKADQKAQTRQRIAAAAGRSFKKNGYSGIGVDGLAGEAGVTSGAFYGHFASKEAAFNEAVSGGLGELQSAISDLKQQYGENWWSEFAAFYTGQKRTCDLSESCALQSLTAEVGRSEPSTQALFEAELLKISKLASDNGKPSSAQNTNKTWASLSMLIGGVSLARAVDNEALSDEISNAIKNAVIALHRSE